MKKIIQIFATLLLLTNLTTHTVQFSLLNKSGQTIWISGYVNDDVFTGSDVIDSEKKLLPDDTFSTEIPNGEVELTISLIEPGHRDGHNIYRKYLTASSANNKNKMLIWNHTRHPKVPLYPSSKESLFGLIKTRVTNNITAKELKLTGYNDL